MRAGREGPSEIAVSANPSALGRQSGTRRVPKSVMLARAARTPDFATAASGRRRRTVAWIGVLIVAGCGPSIPPVAPAPTPARSVAQEAKDPPTALEVLRELARSDPRTRRFDVEYEQSHGGSTASLRIQSDGTLFTYQLEDDGYVIKLWNNPKTGTLGATPTDGVYSQITIAHAELMRERRSAIDETFNDQFGFRLAPAPPRRLRLYFDPTSFDSVSVGFGILAEYAAGDGPQLAWLEELQHARYEHSLEEQSIAIRSEDGWTVRVSRVNGFIESIQVADGPTVTLRALNQEPTFQPSVFSSPASDTHPQPALTIERGAILRAARDVRDDVLTDLDERVRAGTLVWSVAHRQKLRTVLRTLYTEGAKRAMRREHSATLKWIDQVSSNTRTKVTQARNATPPNTAAVERITQALKKRESAFADMLGTMHQKMLQAHDSPRSLAKVAASIRDTVQGMDGELFSQVLDSVFVQPLLSRVKREFKAALSD